MVIKRNGKMFEVIKGFEVVDYFFTFEDAVKFVEDREGFEAKTRDWKNLSRYGNDRLTYDEYSLIDNDSVRNVYEDYFNDDD